MRVVDRIEQYTGSFSGYLYDLDQLLKDSVVDVVSDVNPDAMTQLWVELTDSGSGVSTVGYHFIEARKGLVKAKAISPSVRSQSGPSTDDPYYYRWQGSTYVLPSGGTVLALSYPTVTLSDTSVTSVADDLLGLFCIKTAQRGLEMQARLHRSAILPTVTLPTAPTAPSAPTITATDAVIGTFAASATVAALPALSSFPTATFGGTIADITTNLPTALNLETLIDGSTGKTVPVVPAAPSLTAATVAPTTVGALGTVPAYTKPATTLSFTNWDAYLTAEDPEIMHQIGLKLGTTLEEIKSEIDNEFKEFQKDYRDG